MKTLTKKILTVCLTLAMACALAIPAFADFDNGYNGYHIRNESIGGNNYLNMEGSGGPYHDKAKDALMSVLLLAMMLPFVAIMIPLFKMMSHWGLVNSWAAFVLPSISTPFMIMLFRQASRSFPNDIIEAARLDGLSEIGIFFRMFVPIMRSTYGAAMTVTFMNAWNSYLWPKIVFQSNASITMPMLVANLKSGYSVDYGMLMLGVLICTLPTAIIFLCLQKSFANGITGAVK